MKSSNHLDHKMYQIKFLILISIFLNCLIKINCQNDDNKPSVLEIAIPKNLQEGNEVR